MLPEYRAALPEALAAIREAELIALGPGSLYTSIIPNLLVGGVADAIIQSDSVKVYVGNVMTQEGETEGYTAADHIRAVFLHSRSNLFDLCLVNDSPIPEEIRERYAQEGAEPLRVDDSACAALGVELVRRPVSRIEKGYVRHDPDLLARALIEIHSQSRVRIAGGGYQKEF